MKASECKCCRCGKQAVANSNKLIKRIMSKTTIKVSHKNGHTVMSNDKVEWTFGNYNMLDETIIASLVFQTIFVKFKEMAAYSDDFTIDFTMESTINQKEG